MSEEYLEEGEEVQELSAEEILEQHKAEIEERFEEKGFFTRLSEMFSGLGKPHDTREYKAAVTELQRLKAPIIGIMLPVIGVVALIVITAVQGQKKDIIQVDLSRAVEDTEELKEEEPEPEVEPPDPPEEMPDIQVDTPVVGPQTDMISNTPISNEPVSVKPASQDSVAIIKSPVTMKSMSGSRSPGRIGAMTRGGAGYGDASTEAAVLKALRWLKTKQKTDGSWDPSPISNTGLAILCYLAHGETPQSKEFGSTVEMAIQYLINQQTTKNGVATFQRSTGNEYDTLIATYALGEAYGMTKNPDAKDAAMATMYRIVENQSPTGGWDYKLNKESTRDDMSYAGWALQALKACKLAGLHPEGLDECIKKAMKCLETRNFNNGGFNYTAGGSPTGLTATGCLAMQLLGYGDRKEVSSALDTMRDWVPTFEKDVLKVNGHSAGQAPQYYCYYASQCKYQAGMKQGATPENIKSWQDWNVAIKKLYTSTIITIEGEYEFNDKEYKIGYWENKDAHGAGEVMSTCLCALQLMVYYRYLPTTQAEKTPGGEDAKKKKKKASNVNVVVDI